MRGVLPPLGKERRWLGPLLIVMEVVYLYRVGEDVVEWAVPHVVMPLDCCWMSVRASIPETERLCACRTKGGEI